MSRLCAALGDAGYLFSRLSYRGLATRAIERVRQRELYRPEKVATIGGIVTLRVNTPCGFSDEGLRAIEGRLDEGGYWVLYGHPHSVSDERNPQSLRNLVATLEVMERWHREGKIRFVQPRELAVPVLA